MLAAEAPSVGDLLVGWELVASLVGVFVIALLAGRLLGVRRSWGTTVLSALVGWIGGAFLAVLLARNHEGGEAGFTRNLWLFSAFFTMSAVVWIELLAKPGTLARAQSGLAALPHPITSMRRRGRRVRRYVEITRVATRYGLGRSMGLSDEVGAGADGKSRPPVAQRTRAALEDCGGMFVKLGQILSTRSDLLPASAVQELSKLQDHVAPVPADEVRIVLETELDQPVEAVFAHFDWEPLAAASIGQAHRGRLQSGEEVVVKVQRPGIAESVDRDLEVLGQLARTLESRTTWATEYQVTALATEFGDRLREELDFRVEARNAEEIAGHLAEQPEVHIPVVSGDLTTSRVLVMEWLDGVSVRETEHIDAMGFDRAVLAETLLRCLLQQMLVDGHFHVDPHPGNVLVLADGRIGLIDFGATARLDALQQTSVREMLFAINQQDPSLLRQAVLEVATVRGVLNDDQLERALARFMARHLRPGATPSAQMFNELLQLFFTFGLVLPAEFSSLFRAIVTLEGTITTLSPGYPVLTAAQGFAAELARDRMGADAMEEMARKELLKLVPVLRRLPRQVDRLATMAQRGDLTVRTSWLSTPSDVTALSRLVNRGVLAVLSLVVGLLSVLLLGIQGGPEFTGQTSLYEFFGYFGLFCCTVLVMRLLVAIFREGLN